MHNYSMFGSKRKIKSWASEGLIVFLQPCIDQLEINNSSSLWIIVKIKISEDWTLGLFYLKPGLDLDETIEKLKFVINETSTKFPELPIVCRGEWNSHIRELNQVLKRSI